MIIIPSTLKLLTIGVTLLLMGLAGMMLTRHTAVAVLVAMEIAFLSIHFFIATFCFLWEDPLLFILGFYALLLVGIDLTIAFVVIITYYVELKFFTKQEKKNVGKPGRKSRNLIQIKVRNKTNCPNIQIRGKKRRPLEM